MNGYYFPMSYRGLSMNQHRSAAGAEIEANLKNTYRVDRLDFSRLQQRDQREALHLLTGGDLGDATLAFRYISVAGTVVASTGSKLSDMIAALEQAFDVEEAQLESLSTEGVSAFIFTDTTEVATGRGVAWTDPVTGLSDGERVTERFLARPAAFPIITGRRSGGDTALFAVELVCPDPRRYIGTSEAIILNSGNGFAAAAPNWDIFQGKAVAPAITIVMSGAGAANLTIDVSGDTPGALVLNMSAETAGTFSVDPATGQIKKGSTHKANLRSSALSTILGMRIPRGGANLSATNTGGVTSITFSYRQARM